MCSRPGEVRLPCVVSISSVAIPGQFPPSPTTAARSASAVFHKSKIASGETLRFERA